MKYYGSGNQTVILDHGKPLVDFRRNEEVRKQLASIENPKSVSDQDEEHVTYQDDVSFKVHSPPSFAREIELNRFLVFSSAPFLCPQATQSPSSRSSPKRTTLVQIEIKSKLCSDHFPLNLRLELSLATLKRILFFFQPPRL